MEPENTRYIGEVITVEFDRPPLFSKRPHCPDRFIWRGETYAVVEVLSRRVDFGRRGRRFVGRGALFLHGARGRECGP